MLSAEIGPFILIPSFLITLIEDACATHNQERHDNSLKGVKGYCRIRKTSEILEELT